MIEALKFRHIRFKNRARHFVKLRKKFNNFQDLLNYLDEQHYQDAYYSSALYLNPHLVGPRSEERIGGEVWLKGDFVFDIDIKNVSPLHLLIEKGIKEVRKILKEGNRRKWKLRYVAFSGSKGFHVVFEDPISYPLHFH